MPSGDEGSGGNSLLDVVYLCSAPHPHHDMLLAHFFFFQPPPEAVASLKKLTTVAVPTHIPPAGKGLIFCVLDNYDCLFLLDVTARARPNKDATEHDGINDHRRRQLEAEFVERGMERVLLVSSVNRIRLSQVDTAVIMTSVSPQAWRALPASDRSSRRSRRTVARPFEFETLAEMQSVLPSLLLLPRSSTSSILTILETSEIGTSRTAAETAVASDWMSRKTHALHVAARKGRDGSSPPTMCCRVSPPARPLLEASPRTLSLVVRLEMAQLKAMYLRALLRRDAARRGIQIAAISAPPSQIIAMLDSGADSAQPGVIAASRKLEADIVRLSRGLATAASQLSVWKCWMVLLRMSPLPATLQLPLDADKLLPATQSRFDHFKALEERRRLITVRDKTAAATLREDLRTSSALVAAQRWIGERVGNTLGTVGNLVGAKMFYEPTWECEEHPRFGREMRETQFVLASGITHLDNSAFPLEPKSVRVARQQWRRCIQIDPVLFRFKSQHVRLLQCVVKLSKKLLCSTGDLSILPTYAQALFTVLRSLTWAPQDTLLVINPVENGQLLSQLSLLHTELGVEVIVGRIDPFATHEETVIEFVGMLRKHRPLIAFFPHVDACSRVLPVTEMVAACHENSCVSFVDGSDAVGNVTTNVNAIGSDIYIASIDNYLMAYPGTTALVVKPTLHKIIDTLTVSYFYGEGYSAEWTYTGLSDVSTVLSSFHALQFLKYICFGMREYCRNLAAEARDYLSRAWGVPPLVFPDQDVHAVAVAKIPFTDGCTSSDALHVARSLVDWKVNVGVVCIRSRLLARVEHDEPVAAPHGSEGAAGHEASFLAVRLTCHVYNDMADVKRLAAAVLRFNKIRNI